MLRVAIHPSRESVLVIAQTRDRNGHVADASDATDARYGTSPQYGFAAQPAQTGIRWPQVDVDRNGLFDAILVENDVQTSPSLAGFYEVSAELSDFDAARSVSWPARDPNDTTKSLWFYCGSEFAFRSVYLSFAAAGSYVSGAFQVQYWDGTAWADVAFVEGSRLDAGRGLDDQVSWDRLARWFPCVVQNQLVVTEGSRLVVARELFWVRIRLKTLAGVFSLPILSKCWEGDELAEADPTRWSLVKRPEKLVVARCPMVRDANTHLSSVPVASRKAPATRSTGRVNLGKGDYYVRIPTYDAQDALGKDPASATSLVAGQTKTGVGVTVPVTAEAVVLRPGRYRARVYGEVPNVDANVFLAETGHTLVPGDPSLFDPNDSDSAFDPTWAPVMAGASAHFDVRLAGAMAHVEMQRSGNTRDVYTLWLSCENRRVPLTNQGSARDYARLVVTDTSTGSVLIDTADAAKSVTGGPLLPLATPSGNPDPHLFRYIEDATARKLTDRGQYALTVTIVKNGEAVVSESSLSFFA